MKSLRIISSIIPLIAIIGIMSFVIYDTNVNQVFGQTSDSEKTGSQNSTDPAVQVFNLTRAINSGSSNSFRV
jgi:hypothetical protein